MVSFAALPGQSLPPSARTKPRSRAPQTAQVSLANAGKPTSHAEVRWTNQTLSIAANNSSLNQILLDIAQATGLSISGSISDERVFGTYGPAPALLVVSQLLEGTGSNILIHQDASGQLRELVFTPRLGGVTPPDANAAAIRGSNTDPLPGTGLPSPDGNIRAGRTVPVTNRPVQPSPIAADPGYGDPGATTEQLPADIKTLQELEGPRRGLPAQQRPQP